MFIDYLLLEAVAGGTGFGGGVGLTGTDCSSKSHVPSSFNSSDVAANARARSKMPKKVNFIVSKSKRIDMSSLTRDSNMGCLFKIFTSTLSFVFVVCT